MKILVSGYNGFVGQHFLRHLKKNNITAEVSLLNKADFLSSKNLLKKIDKNDYIFHFAGVNRDINEELVYEKNIIINEILHDSLNEIGFKGVLFFPSSIQENLTTAYGKSKKISRDLFQKQSNKLNYKFFSTITTNLFGPFGKPNYNSFIATFCSQLLDKKKPVIQEDREISLLYIDDFISQIIKLLFKKEPDTEGFLTTKIKVSQVLEKLNLFHDQYYLNHQFPNIFSDFDLNLFNTYRSFINHKYFFPIFYRSFSDNRGNFLELIRSNSSGQGSFSTTKVGITRGNHYHTRKIERFSVVKGAAKITIRDIISSEKIEFILYSSSPAFVDIPVWYTHKIENIGKEELVTFFWINEHYDENNADTFIENV